MRPIEEIIREANPTGADFWTKRHGWPDVEHPSGVFLARAIAEQIGPALLGESWSVGEMAVRPISNPCKLLPLYAAKGDSSAIKAANEKLKENWAATEARLAPVRERARQTSTLVRKAAASGALATFTVSPLTGAGAMINPIRWAADVSASWLLRCAMNPDDPSDRPAWNIYGVGSYHRIFVTHDSLNSFLRSAEAPSTSDEPEPWLRRPNESLKAWVDRDEPWAEAKRRAAAQITHPCQSDQINALFELANCSGFATKSTSVKRTFFESRHKAAGLPDA